MRSYNIAVLNGSKDTTEFEMPVDTVRALNRIEGHRIISINHRKLYDQNGITEASRIIEGQLKKNNIDIVMYGLGVEYDFSIEYFAKLRESYFLVLCAWEDAQYFEKSSKYYSQAFDLVSTEGKLNVQRYAMYGIDAIPYYGAFDTRNWLNMSCKKTRDACFVGSIDKIGRKEYLEHLVNNKVDIGIFGSGTAGGVLSYSDMNKLYCSSKIGLSFSGVSNLTALDKNITINRRIKPIKGRAQEIALTGTFVLAEYSPGLAEIFEIGIEIDVFSSREELLRKLNYYLEHEPEREKMAEKGYLRALRDYEEVNVWKGLMLDIHRKLEIKARSNKLVKNIIYKDSIFKSPFSSYHLFKMLRFLLRGNLKNALAEFLIFINYPLIDGGVFLYYVKVDFINFLVSVNWLRNSVRKLKKNMRKHVAKL
jgi:hypothetical protein